MTFTPPKTAHSLQEFLQANRQQCHLNSNNILAVQKQTSGCSPQSCDLMPSTLQFLSAASKYNLDSLTVLLAMGCLIKTQHTIPFCTT